MKRGDRLLGLILVILVAGITVAGITRYLSQASGITALVRSEGKVLLELRLDKITEGDTLRVETSAGYNVVQWAKGRIRIEEADCPDQVCVRQQWLTKPGQVAACVPHQLLVELR